MYSCIRILYRCIFVFVLLERDEKIYFFCELLCEIRTTVVYNEICINQRYMGVYVLLYTRRIHIYSQPVVIHEFCFQILVFQVFQ